MQIGIDFDNTIVSYDALFYRVGIERDLIPAHVQRTKVSVRDFLRRAGREADWTEMQGYVYGARMEEAAAYPGVIDFLRWARAEGIGVCIVSHKTRNPIVGHPYDLHDAARKWISKFLMPYPEPLVASDNVYFELTKDEKLSRISALQLDCFIDDLPEILTASAFPRNTAGLLFDPDEAIHDRGEISSFNSWHLIQQHVRNLWANPL